MRFPRRMGRCFGRFVLVLFLLEHALAHVAGQVASANRTLPTAASKTDENVAIPLGFAQKSFPDAMIGVPYQSSVQAIGGSGLYDLSATGDMPPGLSMETGASTLAFGGVPTTTGTYAFQVIIRDADGTSFTHDFSIQVYPRVLGAKALQTSPAPSDSEGITLTDVDAVFLPAKVLDNESITLTDAVSGLDAAEIPDNESIALTDTITVAILTLSKISWSEPAPITYGTALSATKLDATGDVAGTFVISTCNRIEIYADVDRFHGSVATVCELLSRYSGIVTHELTGHLYVHYEEGAVKHLLAVAAGLDSMVVGEGQILGQVRSALKAARDNGTLGRVLGEVGSAALRTGKRAHSETGIDRTGASLVSVGIGAAAEALGRPSLSGLDVLVVGAGSMSALAATTASRAGAAHVTVANRTRGHAQRLAASVGGGTADLADLPSAIAAADLVISCTGASGLVITADIAASALSLRRARGGGDTGTAAGRPLVFLDLAMPRDVDPQVAGPPGVTVIGMDELADAGRSATALVGVADEVAAVRAIVEEEFSTYRAAAHATQVTPTVVALWAKAAEVVDAELARLAGRLHGADGLDGRALEEIARTVRRVVDKLLHAPTVRVKELAGSPRGDGYDEALRVLFDLDPRTVEAVTCADPEQPDADSARLPAPSADEGSRE